MSPSPSGRLPSMERTVVVCELTGPLDLTVLDALARLVLAARRRGLRCELSSTEPGLLCLTGLDEALLQPVRQPEPGEQRRRVEEVVQVDEPPV